MRTAGVDESLVAQVEPYLAATPWAADKGAHVLVHGDLTHLNFLVAQCDDMWRITGLIDWGDAKIGSPTHEFISPGVHMYKGDKAALLQWYQGYQWQIDEERTADYQQVVMARTMLYYADSFSHLIQTVQGAAFCSDWSTMASAFFQMHVPQSQ
jgi:hygromycin-B 7''-O-kinase